MARRYSQCSTFSGVSVGDRSRAGSPTDLDVSGCQSCRAGLECAQSRCSGDARVLTRCSTRCERHVADGQHTAARATIEAGLADVSKRQMVFQRRRKPGRPTASLSFRPSTGATSSVPALGGVREWPEADRLLQVDLGPKQTCGPTSEGP